MGSHREVMLNLDKKGTHLKYFSQKQDVILIKNLLISVQHRWERVVSKAAERTRALDHGYKEAKEVIITTRNITWKLPHANLCAVTEKIVQEIARLENEGITTKINHSEWGISNVPISKNLADYLQRPLHLCC